MGQNGKAALRKEREECADAVKRIQRVEGELDKLYPKKCPEPIFPIAIGNVMRAQNGGIIALLNARVAQIEVGEERAQMDAQIAAHESKEKTGLRYWLLKGLVRVGVFLVIVAVARIDDTAKVVKAILSIFP